MSTPYSVKKGTALWIPGTGPPHDPGRGHLFIILTDPCANGKVLAVPVNSLTKRSDKTCVLKQGEHARIKHDSFAAYYRAQQFSASVLEKQVGQKVIFADSDDLARVFRFDLAQDSEMISPTIPI